ncbi:MAG: hypothetical protein AAFY71_14785 [Bacteroidota bacterium]
MNTRFICLICPILLIFLVLPSCAGDPCEDVECQNGGICLDGTCDCPENFFGRDCEFQLDPCTIQQCSTTGTDTCIVGNDDNAICRCKDGYQGERCEELWTEAFPGTFQAQEDCEGETQTFEMVVETGPSFNQVTLGNLHNQANPQDPAKLVGNLLRSTFFDMYPQFMPFGRVTGFGNLNDNNSISVFYTIIENSDTLQCSALLLPL